MNKQDIGFILFLEIKEKFVCVEVENSVSRTTSDDKED
jgi:hypothetical protein